MAIPGMVPNPAYVVPSPGVENPRDWADEPEITGAHDPGIPDPMRTGRLRTRDYRPHPADPPQDFWLGVHGPGREYIARHSLEYLDADGRDAEAPRLKPQTRNPRETVAPEPRPTNRMSPSTWTFTRPFDQHAARQLNGVHFSMADHRRSYAILGMEPVRRRRNTFRAEPAPWDSDLVDMPNDAGYGNLPGPVRAVEVPATRNFRLT